jgi:tRNA(Glu) U13 pseudouridine synthase TruD
MVASQAGALELETAALQQIGLDEAELAPLGRWAPGTRRDLLLKPSELQCHADVEGSVVFDFVLPAGSYATVLIDTFTRGLDADVGETPDEAASDGDSSPD